MRSGYPIGKETLVGERVTVTRFDDFDNELEANETITFALDETTYEVDLSDQNAKRIRSELQKWIDVSRKVAGSSDRRRADRNGDSSDEAGLPLAEIRAWARANGVEVPNRGRVSIAIVRAWTAATSNGRSPRGQALKRTQSPDTAADATLDAITQETKKVTAALVALYDAIRTAKENDYSYNELEAATGLSRGTLQNIAAGKNPRFGVE